MIYNSYGLYIECDFEIRIVREDDTDADLLIPIKGRPLNVFLSNMPCYIKDKFQFPSVYGILIRIAKADDNNIATVHILKNIDLLASIMNFEIDYKDMVFSIFDTAFSCEWMIEERV